MDKKLALLLACCMMGGAAMSCNEVEPFTDPLPACKENVRVCGEQDGKVVAMVCHNGQFAVEATCEGATPACDPLKGTCVAAQPSTPVCTANDKKCDTNRVVTCDTDGSKWTVTEDCGSDKVCNETTKTCETPQATDCTLADGSTVSNNTTVCKDDKTYACADGNATETACVAPAHATALCAGNACSFTCDEGYRATEDKTGCELIPVCTADEKRCTDKNVETCAADGSAWTVTDTCEETESCNATTFECEVPPPDACNVEGVGSVPSGSTVCKDGKTYACADGTVTETACEAPEHAMATCEENACAFTCAGDYVLSEDKKSCVEKPCEEGATKCEIVGEAPMTSTCEDGAWKEATECPAPANATAICTTDNIKCDFTCGEGYTKVEASEGVEAACQKDVPPVPQSCEVEGSTIANGETKCIGSSLYACADGTATSKACTTTVEHATSTCNTDMTACDVKCEEGYVANGEGDVMTCEEEAAGCTDDVCAIIDGVATLQRCMPSFGALTDPEPCSSVYGADANANYACNTAGNACVIKDCKDGYELKEGACVAKTPTCTDTEGLVGEVGQTYENEWLGCSKDKTARVVCGPYGSEGYVLVKIECETDKGHICKDGEGCVEPDPEPECTTNEDCTDSSKPVCDTTTNTCVAATLVCTEDAITCSGTVETLCVDGEAVVTDCADDGRMCVDGKGCVECTEDSQCTDGDKLFCGADGKCTDESTATCETETYTCNDDNIEIWCSESGSYAKVCEEGKSCVEGKGCVEPAECKEDKDCTDGDKLFCVEGLCVNSSATTCETDIYTCKGDNIEILCNAVATYAEICEVGKTCEAGKGCVGDTPVGPECKEDKDCTDGDKLYCSPDGECVNYSTDKCEVATNTCQGNVVISCDGHGTLAATCEDGKKCVDGDCVDDSSKPVDPTPGKNACDADGNCKIDLTVVKNSNSQYKTPFEYTYDDGVSLKGQARLDGGETADADKCGGAYKVVMGKKDDGSYIEITTGNGVGTVSFDYFSTKNTNIDVTVGSTKDTKSAKENTDESYTHSFNVPGSTTIRIDGTTARRVGIANISWTTYSTAE